jgi:hypothetical protein
LQELKFSRVMTRVVVERNINVADCWELIDI